MNHRKSIFRILAESAQALVAGVVAVPVLVIDGVFNALD